MKKHEKLPQLWQWGLIILIILTLFSAWAGYMALKQLQISGARTAQEQNNLMGQLEFRIAFDEDTCQPFRKDENNEEK